MPSSTPRNLLPIVAAYLPVPIVGAVLGLSAALLFNAVPRLRGRTAGTRGALVVTD